MWLSYQNFGPTLLLLPNVHCILEDKEKFHWLIFHNKSCNLKTISLFSMSFWWKTLETSYFTGVSNSLTEEVSNRKKNGAQKYQRVFEPPCICASSFHTHEKYKHAVYTLVQWWRRFNHVIIQTCDNWFQKYLLEHQSSDYADLLYVFYQWKKDTALLSAKFDRHLYMLWFRKTEIQDRAGMKTSSCDSLMSYDLQNVLNILAEFLQIYIS